MAAMAYVTTWLFAAPSSRIQSVFSKIFFVSFRYLNQLDAALNVMYRHETRASLILTIICLQRMQWPIRSGKFMSKANRSVGQHMPQDKA